MAKQPAPAPAAQISKTAQDSALVTDSSDVTRDDRHKVAGVVGDISGAQAQLAGPNFKRSRAYLPLFLVAMVTAVGSSVGVAIWAKSMIEKRIAALQPPRGGGAESEPAAGDAGSRAQIDTQILALQTQLDTWRREQLLSQKDLRESIERVSGAVHGTAQQSLVPLDPSQVNPTGERTAEMIVNVTPTQKEFIMLKERNRLTAYADEAIATGARKPLETIVEYLRDPSAADLHDAAQAEYMRAIRSIQTLQREDPGYRLPLAELFNDEGIRNEADLKPDQLFKLLEDVKQPWEVRLRAAILLRGSDAQETNAKLIRAIKEDPFLDVANHAQIALEQRIGRRFRMFDIPAIDAWWAAQGNP